MKRILVLGGRAAGKTTFIAGLAEYCRASRGGKLRLIPLDDPSRGYLDLIQEFLRAGQWPPATSDVHLVSFRLVTLEREELVLEVIDYPGEVVELLHRGQELGPWQKVLDSIGEVDKVLLLLSVDHDLSRPESGDGPGQRQDAAASLLARLLELQREAATPSIAIREGLEVIPVVTKADLAFSTAPGDGHRQSSDKETCEELDQCIRALLESLQQLGIRVRPTQFLSAAGGPGEAQGGVHAASPPEKLAPWGFDELVEEIQSVERERRATRGLLITLFLVVIAAAVAGVVWLGGERKLRKVKSIAESRPTSEVLARFPQKLDAESESGAAVRSRISREVENLAAQLDLAPSLADLDEGIRQLADLSKNPNNPQVGRTRDVLDAYKLRLEGRLVEAMEGAPTFLRFRDELAEYKVRFGEEGSMAVGVRDMVERRMIEEKNQLRRTATQISPSSPEAVRERLERSLEFVKLFPQDSRSIGLRVANRVADRILTATSIQVSVRRVVLDSDSGYWGDDLRIEIYSGRTQAEEDRVDQSETVDYSRDTTWEASGAGVAYQFKLAGAKREILLAVNDPGSGPLNGKDKWGAVVLSPIEDFVFHGEAVPLREVGDSGASGLNIPMGTARYLNPLTAIAQESIAQALEEVESAWDPNRTVGRVTVEYRIGSVEDFVVFTEEERLTYLRYYLTGYGWNLE